MAGIALAGMMSLSGAVERWDKGLAGTLTVQIPAPAKGSANRNIAAAIKALKSAPGVTSARALSEQETALLLEPWLGSGDFARDLPLPRLIDVQVRTGAAPDIEGLSALVQAAAPGAIIDNHRKSLDRLIALARAGETVALAIVILVALAAISTVVFITRTGLAIHASGIELLHLIGATDSYVARQFQGQALELAFKGGIIGLSLAAAMVFLIGRAAGALGSGLLPDLSLTAGQWGMLVLVPVAVAVISMVTARITVLRALKSLP
ncbi:MAG: cell division transport system permease protein [Alphaproteobacteria bacterium]